MAPRSFLTPVTGEAPRIVREAGRDGAAVLPWVSFRRQEMGAGVRPFLQKKGRAEGKVSAGGRSFVSSRPVSKSCWGPQGQQ